MVLYIGIILFSRVDANSSKNIGVFVGIFARCILFICFVFGLKRFVVVYLQALELMRKLITGLNQNYLNSANDTTTY